MKAHLSNFKRPEGILNLMEQSSLGTINLSSSEVAHIQHHENEEIWHEPNEKIIISPSIHGGNSIFEHILNCFFFIFR